MFKLLASTALAVVLLTGCTPAQEELWFGTPEERAAQEREDAPYRLACIQSGGSWNKLVRRCKARSKY